MINRMVQLVAEQSIDRSSEVMSKMLSVPSKINLKEVCFVDSSEVTAFENENNREVIATIIDLVGDAPFKFLFFVGIKDAFILTDLFLEQPIGTTKVFDDTVQSTIQEMGNIISSAVTNVFVSNFQIKLKPSPPIVLKDFSGMIFQEFIMESVSESDKMLLIKSIFKVISMELDCNMYMLPVGGSETILGFSTGIPTR